MYTAKGRETGEIYATGHTRAEVMRKLENKYEWSSGKNGQLGSAYPEPLIITIETVRREKEQAKTEKQRNRELILQAELGNEEAKKILREKFREKTAGLNNPRSVKIKVTRKTGEVIITRSISEAARLTGAGNATVKYHTERGTSDTKGNKFERIEPNE